jgi:hypothetical protein
VALYLVNVGLDCEDVWRVANFWSAALERPIDEGSSDVFASIGGADEQRTQPAWFFHQVPEPQTTKNRVHVDLVDPSEERVARLVDLGARVIQDHDIGFHSWTVMEDPEGHVFCVAAKVYAG